MKKILLRATINPLANATPYDVIVNNYAGNNSGNLLFPFSIMRMIMDEEVVIDTNNKFSYTEEELDRINSEYDCYIVALANAFRSDFVSNLKQLTKVIRSLKIPCIVVGVGVQAAFEPDLSTHFPFDDAVKEFVSAVLEKSVSIGVRGEITATYLNKLGFSQVDIIGCPSMYMLGDNLTLNSKKDLTKDSVLSVNVSSGMPYPFLRFLETLKPEFPNYYFVPQENKELILLYGGVPFPQRFKGQNLFPNELSRPTYREDHVRYFVNVPSWLSYMQNIDFSFGTRIHGNIAAVLGGVPTFVFASDSRVRELASYHNISFMHVKNVNENTDLREIYQNADFSNVLKGHSERFGHFLDFLDNNNIPHPSREALNGQTVFDKAVAEIKWEEAVRVITAVDKEEQEKRLTLFGKYMQTTNDSLNQKLKNNNQTIESLKKRNEELEERIKILEKKPEQKQETKEELKKSIGMKERLKKWISK